MSQPRSDTQAGLIRLTTRFSLARASAESSRFSLRQRAVAELVATALFIFIGVGSVPAVLLQGDVTSASGADLGFIALTFGLIIAGVCYVFGPVSGSHINPAVTIALAAVRQFPAREVPAYVAAQMIGAVAGAAGIWIIFTDRAIDLGYGFGLTHFDTTVTSWTSALLAEGFGTGVLMFIVLGLGSKVAPSGWAGLIIGLAVAAIIVTLGPVTGGAINPARAFGPLVISTIAGSVHNWDQWVGYLVAECLGACVAALAYMVVTSPRPELDEISPRA
ncbi:MIP/aquaporin family protein [Capillimicrobium parvum]|uniref:Aquaporin Z n=1 Tax=Capillimicrobium parvum TaxID=2884022 RepID=A0A9E7C1L0_9ACTN|nr:MIP/aquaporin family protein [Capillimicrobium parvum]UGS36538.1 Aquaporin Z [Capillimicrobium parvum]